jgi:arginine/lysine/ornithine decarboxylase
METPIYDFLKKYGSLNLERAHMPGHKGVLYPLNGFDITEIDGAVDIIEQSERFAAQLFGAKRTLFSCSGSTLAIFAMLSFCAGKRVTTFRGVHRSFIDAAILLDFEIDYFPEINDNTAAIFATSIDYYGNTTDIKSLADLSVPLLVDNAHGAYLVFTQTPCHPIRLGAAMSADSAHKTLPALTGAAYLHFSQDCCDEYAKSADDALGLFGTSSPSYLILNSLDLCNKHISCEKERAASAFEAVRILKENLTEIGYSLHKSDLLRITVNINPYGYYGKDYAEQLRNCGVVCEMYDKQHVILLFSTITQEKNTLKVFEAMRSIPKKLAIESEPVPIVYAKQVVSPRQAYFSKKRTVLLHESIDEVCAGIHVSIPPCAPLIIPGEVFTREAVLLLENSGIHEVDVIAQYSGLTF